MCSRCVTERKTSEAKVKARKPLQSRAAGADTKHLREAAGEIFGVVEADLIGNLGDVAVTRLRRKEFLGHVQAVVADELPNGNSGLGIEMLAGHRTAHAKGIAELLDTNCLLYTSDAADE